MLASPVMSGNTTITPPRTSAAVPPQTTASASEVPASVGLRSGSRAAKLALACATPERAQLRREVGDRGEEGDVAAAVAPSARAVISTLTNESSATARLVP